MIGTFLVVLFVALAISLWLIVVARYEAALQRAPDFIIGREDDPYLLRWYVIPRNRVFNIYLHELRRSDDDRALHDHPWMNVSRILAGGYWEVTSHGREWVGAGTLVFRSPRMAHRLEVEPGQNCRSLFITGPKVREWGFLCPQGWRHWQDFVDMSETGAIGPGCGEG
jgi:hypothetical protein